MLMSFTAYLRIFVALSLPVVAGCASPFRVVSTREWVADYDTAEHRMRQSNRDLLIFYVDDRAGHDGIMDGMIKEPAVKDLGQHHICCTLVKSFEPDRRYVAQYGVDRAPALIRVHRDGTYHATTQVLSTHDILQFVQDSTSPGATPASNAYIPRKARYMWLDSIEQGQQIAGHSERSMLVLLYRSWTGDWDQMEDLLAPHEVYSRLSSMVHVRERHVSIFANHTSTPFGDLQLPALVIVAADGAFRTLELPTSSDAIVRFADSALAPSSNHGNDAPETQQALESSAR